MRRSPYIPLLIFALLFFLLNGYAFSALSLVLPTMVLSWLWTLPVALFLAFGYSMIRLSVNGPTNLFKISAHALLIYFVSTLVFVLATVLTDIYRLIVAIVKYFAEGNFSYPERPLTGIYLGVLLSIFIIIAFIYGILKGKYAYRVIKHTLYFEDLPAAFDGFKLVQISDVHAGSLKNPKAVQKGIDLINKQHADLFVFTGDLVNNKAEEIKPYIQHFSKIKAPFGQFSVLGNHDYGDYIKWESDFIKQQNLQQLKNYHAEIGFRLLLDEHVTLEKDGQKLALVGIENWGLGFGERGDLNKALQGTTPKEFKILLSHDPSHWEAQVKNHSSKIQLTLAGHTHGMQFGFEAFGLKWSPVQFRYKHWAGIKQENRRILNVNRGFGFIGFSGRVGIWPEITLIELKKR
ncbi:metallophosphoesterase [Pedobacter chitinilyticus]|uniref:Metallophosphoesterase n=1 Tax=Pedobacter chitinilyticus TaxID=2233776 RepID=A0A443YNQ7_9SPHI|nr:metallophosphoesterase [Pedobacter chitinilyticus]RWU05429.1 metallophosphoesterase [Pedobacter chitinilyticus]